VGLALSRGLVTAMGGSLTVRSTLDEGSTFTVELAHTDAPDERAESIDARRTDTGIARPHVVLYIEDNVANLRLVQRILAGQPELTLISAMQGSLGVALAKQHQPSVILLDLHLPDLSGEEVFRLLQADPATRAIPVVVVSADATPGRTRRLLEMGVSEYLTKPLDLDLFRSVINQLCAD